MANILNQYGMRVLRASISELEQNKDITSIVIDSSWCDDNKLSFKVNWAAQGATDSWSAKLYGERIKNTADIVDMLNKMNLVEDYDFDNTVKLDIEQFKIDVSKCAWAIGTQLIGTLGDCLNSIGGLVSSEDDKNNDEVEK